MTRSRLLLRHGFLVLRRRGAAATGTTATAWTRTTKAAKAAATRRMSSRPVAATTEDDDEQDEPKVMLRIPFRSTTKTMPADKFSANPPLPSVSLPTPTNNIKEEREEEQSQRQQNTGEKDPHRDDEESLSASKPSFLTYTGGVMIPITTELHIVAPEEDTPRGTWPVYRIMVST